LLLRFKAYEFCVKFHYMGKNNKYTCAEYREEMMLLGLKKRLNDKDISEEERWTITREIEKLEIDMDIN